MEFFQNGKNLKMETFENGKLFSTSSEYHSVTKYDRLNFENGIKL